MGGLEINVKEDNSKKKDNRIELLRFIFAGLLMIFHGHLVNGVSHPIPKGHVFVEFFLQDILPTPMSGTIV